MDAQNAPVTMVANITNAVPGNSVAVPVTVTGFTSIGRFTLALSFDTTRVLFVSAALNLSLPGMTITYFHAGANKRATLVLNWQGSATNYNLADGSSLADLTFKYITGSGIIKWDFYFGSGCQYWKFVGSNLTLLPDSPQYLFYINGGIANRGAPATYAPILNGVAPGAFSVPVTVNGFTDIGALTLYLEYDPDIITYQNSFTVNAAFVSSFLVGNITGTGGKKLLVIQWYGSAVTLANGATLCTLNFTLPGTGGGGSALTFFDNGPSCEYSTGSSDVLMDYPGSSYYHNGMVAPPVSVSVSPSAATVCAGTPVTYTASPVYGGTTPAYQWKVNGNNTGSNSPTLVYAPATGDAVNCTLTSNAPYVSGNPATSNTVVTSVTTLPAVTAGFSADNLSPPKNTTVSLTDYSTGTPISWMWTFDRPTIQFINGTSATSQNPQVQFTDGGLYSVTLSAHNSCNSGSLTKTGYIRAGLPGLWLGTLSADWTVPGNWDNQLLPDGNTDVVIPSSAVNWPVVEGNLIIGAQCHNLTLSGSSSRMTVNGNLTILP